MNTTTRLAKLWTLLAAAALAAAALAADDDRGARPTIVGAMRETMFEGKLAGRIDLDAIPRKEHLYGLGPVEFLRGELLILDGESYVATVGEDGAMRVERSFSVRAPFFAYANIERWAQTPLPADVSDLASLERFLDGISQGREEPYFFKLIGRARSAAIHVVNLPDGAEVRSPKDAHRNMSHYNLEDQAVALLGFYSTRHHAILTHHDTNLHAHLITQDRASMGHLESVEFDPAQMALYLPQRSENPSSSSSSSSTSASSPQAD